MNSCVTHHSTTSVSDTVFGCVTHCEPPLAQTTLDYVISELLLVYEFEDGFKKISIILRRRLKIRGWIFLAGEI